MKNPIRAIPSALILVFLAFLNTIAAQAQSPYTITGELRDDSGQLFSGGNVCAMQPVAGGLNVRDRACAVSDAEGKFVVNISQPGTYQVVADKMSDGYMPTYSPFYKDPKAI